MKNWKRIFTIIATLIIILSLIYAIILSVAKNMFADQIQKATGLKTTIGKLSILPPLAIDVRGFEITGLIKAERIYVVPSIRNLLFGKLVFNEIFIGAPEFTYQRNPPAEPVQDSRAPVMDAQTSVATTTSGKGLALAIRKLRINNGNLNFTDNTATSGKISVLVKDINLNIFNISTFGSKEKTNFDLKSKLSWASGEPDGTMLLEGWVDFNQKNMSAALKIQKIDAIVFYPYYSTWVDLEQARIEQAKLNFNCDIQGVNNDVTANCHLELADMVRKVRQLQEPRQKAERITDAVLDMFKTMDAGKVVLDFILRTKMDRPEFGFDNIKSAFEGKLMQARSSAGLRPQDVLSWPRRWLQSGIKTGLDLSNAVIDGLSDLGGGLKQFVEERMDRSVPVQEHLLAR